MPNCIVNAIIGQFYAALCVKAIFHKFAYFLLEFEY